MTNIGLKHNLLLSAVKNAYSRKLLNYFFWKSPRSFNNIYQSFDKIECPAEASSNLQGDKNDNKVDEIVLGLSEDGISYSNGLFNDPQFLKEARNLFEKSMDEYDRAYKKWIPGTGYVENKDSGVQYQFSDKDPTLKYWGRKRVFFPEGCRGFDNSVLTELCSEKLYEVGKKYYGVMPTLRGVLFENLLPSIEGDFWHVDSLVDQYKAMILLDDVGEDNGPIRYKTGSHKLQGGDRSILTQQMYKYGLPYAYPSQSVMESMEGEVRYGKGKAGDCVVFDTLGLHSGTRCIERGRWSIVIYFKVDTLKNKFISDLNSWNLY